MLPPSEPASPEPLDDPEPLLAPDDAPVDPDEPWPEELCEEPASSPVPKP